MATFLMSRWQNSKERPYRSTNNGDMAETGKHYIFCEWVKPEIVVCEFQW